MTYQGVVVRGLCKTRAILGVVTKIIPNVPLGNQTTDIKFVVMVAPGSFS
jgi:hypothetical protein